HDSELGLAVAVEIAEMEYLLGNRPAASDLCAACGGPSSAAVATIEAHQPRRVHSDDISAAVTIEVDPADHVCERGPPVADSDRRDESATRLTGVQVELAGSIDASEIRVSIAGEVAERDDPVTRRPVCGDGCSGSESAAAGSSVDESTTGFRDGDEIIAEDPVD